MFKLDEIHKNFFALGIFFLVLGVLTNFYLYVSFRGTAMPLSPMACTIAEIGIASFATFLLVEIVRMATRRATAPEVLLLFVSMVLYSLNFYSVTHHTDLLHLLAPAALVLVLLLVTMILISMRTIK